MKHILSNTIPLLSVIVPVYQAELFLPQCVNSLLVQSHRDFELLLIDDGSPDSSGTMCDAYAEKDSRVRVIHKTNGGVSSARNAGLDAARGDYVVFVDSDDYVDPGYLDGLLAALPAQAVPEKTLVITDYQPFTPKGDETRSFPQAFTVRLPEAGSQVFRDLIFGFRLFPPYCKLYRREIIEAEHLRFDTSIRTAEDFDFNMRYVAHVETICYRPIPSYHYRVDYKKYRPSNHGILGDSEIKSAHIMANGITDLARRMDVYEQIAPEIFRWAAKKHYFNRMPMLFAESRQVGKDERRKLYQRLIADPVYRDAARAGIHLLPDSTTKTIACRADCFAAWYLFYSLQRFRNKKHQAK